MAIILPGNVNTSVGDALTVTVAQVNSTIIVRDGFYLLADGNTNNAIDVNSGSNAHTILIDGYLGTDDANALELNDSSNHEITIGVNGMIAAGSDGVAGTGTTIMLTNDGAIVAGSNAVSLGGSGINAEPVVVNNGSMTATSDAIFLADGGRVTNTGSISSHADGINLGNYNGVDSDSVLINSGTINADDDGVQVTGANFTGTNTATGAIMGQSRGLELGSLADFSTFTNAGIVSGSSEGIYAQGVDTLITNTGSITGGDGVEFTDTNGQVINEGIISGEGGTGVIGENGLVVTNQGTISGDDSAIYAESSTLVSTGLGDQQVLNTGILSSRVGTAVYLEGTDGLVDNAGKIMSGQGYGVHITGAVGLVANSGDIDSRDAAIWLQGANGYVTNSGTVTTDDEGIFLSDGGSILNSGAVNARTYAIYMAGSTTRGFIDNSGDVVSIASSGIQIYNDTGVVNNSGSVVASVYGIYSASEFGSILNSGDVTANNVGIYHAGGLGEFRITNSGDVTSLDSAIRAGAGTEIVNAGTLNGQIGIYVNANANTVDTNVLNAASGVIDGETHGIYLFDSDEDALVINHGSIRGGVESMHFENATGSTARLVNTGSMTGDVQGDTGVQMIANSGVIVGDVFLSDGADLHRNLAAGVVDGTVYGEGGADTLIGGASNDNLDGGNDSDLLVGHDGDDTLIGGEAADTLLGGAGDDSLDGGSESDVLNGGNGNDQIIGGLGTDLLIGQDGSDTLDGGDANDTMDGGDGDDVLEGGDGSDILRGRNGEDELAGGLGADLLTGGQGADSFVFRSVGDAGLGLTRDQILDFEQGVDLIVVAGLSPGVFEFKGTGAFDTAVPNPELRLFETVTGSTIVQFDVNGDAVVDAEIRVANVTGLTAEDFVL